MGKKEKVMESNPKIEQFVRVSLETLLLQATALLKPGREYAVLTSGHGYAYRFDGENPCNPPVPLLTFEEAKEQAKKWMSIADTIAGHAYVYHVPTGSYFNSAGEPCKISEPYSDRKLFFEVSIQDKFIALMQNLFSE